jgi:hypothetical protein
MFLAVLARLDLQLYRVQGFPPENSPAALQA